MGYLHVQNLYKEQDILLFRECYAMEKIHGTSAHISWKNEAMLAPPGEGGLRFFSGGEKHDNFVALFDQAKLLEGFTGLGVDEVVVYGEAYGGKCQGMKAVYGDKLRFVAFDVKIGDSWLSVPQAEEVVTKGLGLEFVPYVKISTDLASIDAERDADSVQAVRNGCGTGHKREGVVLRPLVEVRKNNDQRVIAKHKRDDFSERATPQKVVDPTKLVVLQEASAIADEWVTPMRLSHVLGKLEADGKVLGPEDTKSVIQAMIEDVIREAEGEIADNPDVRRSIGRKSAELFKGHMRSRLAKTQVDLSK